MQFRVSSERILFCLLFCCLSVGAGVASAHDGPDPIGHWSFGNGSIVDGELAARLGPNAKAKGRFEVVKDSKGESLLLSENSSLTIAEDWKTVKSHLPTKAFTVSAWVAINQPRQYGGIIGVIQDNGSAEKGWVVGYNDRKFYFALSTTGADDGNGKMTYLVSNRSYEPGRMYHLVATYDGQVMKIYVNGEFSGQSTEQSGDILYPEKAAFVLGKYLDRDENFAHVGRLRDIALYDLAAKTVWARHEFEKLQQVAALPPIGVTPVKLEFQVKPYLQFVTQTGITVMAQTTRPCQTVVAFGEDSSVGKKMDGQPDRQIHEIRLKDLKPETQYFYKVICKASDGKSIESPVFTFQTASRPGTPFSFAVISDTQSNPKVAGKVATMAWDQRPNFLLHPGDLVGTGTIDKHWTREFFPAMHPLISRVAFFPVLGNHEVNARNYFDYMSLPQPEYYYEFQYGNAHFFMIDTNRKVDPDSEQYKWLDQALSKSTATWKFVCHHHPPYSSDENDYGNLWKTNKSTRGDLRARQLTQLYDKYAVDIVWNGHIHSYERTWPIYQQKVVKGKGSIYMITGGGGGGLETPGPYKPFFQNNVRRGHHYCMVAINHGVLEFKAYDLDNRLFDYIKIEKVDD